MRVSETIWLSALTLILGAWVSFAVAVWPMVEW